MYRKKNPNVAIFFSILWKQLFEHSTQIMAKHINSMYKFFSFTPACLVHKLHTIEIIKNKEFGSRLRSSLFKTSRKCYQWASPVKPADTEWSDISLCNSNLKSLKEPWMTKWNALTLLEFVCIDWSVHADGLDRERAGWSILEILGCWCIDWAAHKIN